MNGEKMNTDEKALQINLDAKKYGTFAEIGAGQEVARRFFHVGKASGRRAKNNPADARYLFGRLGTRSQRPRGRRAAKNRDELASSHWDLRRVSQLMPAT